MSQTRTIHRATRIIVAGTGLVAAAASAAPSLSGCYDGSAPEIAAGLELEADGRFAYALAYGALDETAEGRWDSNGASVFLTSDPTIPPRFSLTGESAGAKGAFRIVLDVPPGMNPQYFDVRLTLSNGEMVEHQLADDGLAMVLEPGMRVGAVQLLLPIFELASDPFALTSGNGREVRFRFEPNDLGEVAFAHTPLRIDRGDLLLERHDRRLRLRRVAETCR